MPERRLVLRFGGGPSREDQRLWVEQRLGEGWIAAFRILTESGRPIVAEVRVFPDEPRHGAGQWSAEKKGVTAKAPQGGVPANVLRRIRLGDVYEMLGDAIRDRNPDSAEWFILTRHMGFKEEATKAPRHPGRRGRPDIFYAKLAQDYVTLLAQGERHPVRVLAQDLRSGKKGNEWWTDETLRQLLVEARRRGLLSPAPSGRAGGHLTAKSKRMLGLEDARPSKARKRKGDK